MALDGGKSDWWHGYENDAIIFFVLCVALNFDVFSLRLSGDPSAEGSREKEERKKMKNDKVLLEKLRFSLLAFTTHTNAAEVIGFPSRLIPSLS